MTYSEPPIYPSSSFVSIQYSERPTDQGRWWGANQRFTIPIRSPSQNEFFDSTKMRLQFSVLSVVQPAPSQTNNYDNDYPVQPGTGNTSGVGVGGPVPWVGGPTGWGLPCSTASDAAVTLPGAASWGVPFFAAVNCQIPGVPIDSFMTTNVESQWMASTRLLCASGTGSFDPVCGRSGFKISGEAELSGARSVRQRLQGVTTGIFFTDRTGNSMISGTESNGADPPVRINIQNPNVYYPAAMRGTLQHYSVPLSFFCPLFNGVSNLIPIGFYSTSSDAFIFRFETAPVNDVINNVFADRPDIVGPGAYYIIDPTISCTKLQISSPPILAAVESLYRGQLSIPIGPGVNVPLAFVMKMINYNSASTVITSAAAPNVQATGPFSLQLPANQPSCRGIALRFCSDNIMGGGLYTGNPASTVQQHVGVGEYYWSGPWRYMVAGSQSTYGGQWNGRYLMNLNPILKDFQVRIASFRCPLDALSDTALPPGYIPIGLATAPTQLAVANPFDDLPGGPPDQNIATTPLSYINQISTLREAARFYQQGKLNFTPFATDDIPFQNALSPWFAADEESSMSADALFFRGMCIVGMEEFWGQSSAHAAIPAALDVPVYNGNIATWRLASGALNTRRWMIGKDDAEADDFHGITYRAQTDGRDRVPLPYWCNTGLWIIPLETIGAIYNHKDDAYALRGYDLRSIGQITVSGNIVGVAAPTVGDVMIGPAAVATSAPDFVGLTQDPWDTVYTVTQANAYSATYDGASGPSPPSTGITDQVICRQWTIRGLLAYDQEHVLLPGRVDVDAQFSLVPTGATAIPSGGAPAM